MIFMDHMMPIMDGIDATAQIRKQEGKYFASLPIIALTANALVGTREMFIQEGMNDFIAKPIEVRKLNQVIARWLPRSKIIKKTTLDEAVRPKLNSEWQIAGVDVAKGIISVGSNQKNYLSILSTFYLDGCTKATKLLEYVVAGDILAFRIEVHAIKSTSATIGADKVSAMAERLEIAAKNDDIDFINEAIGDFLAAYKDILEAIKPIAEGVKKSTPVQNLRASSKEGDIDNLNEMLKVLYDAAEIANISQIDEVLDKLNSFTWSEKITVKLNEITSCQAMFDYDGVLELVKQLL